MFSQDEIDNFTSGAQVVEDKFGSKTKKLNAERLAAGLDFKTIKDLENVRNNAEMIRKKINTSENSWYVNKPDNLK